MCLGTSGRHDACACLACTSDHELKATKSCVQEDVEKFVAGASLRAGTAFDDASAQSCNWRGLRKCKPVKIVLDLHAC